MRAPQPPEDASAAASAQTLTIADPEEMREFGRRLASELRPGDLVLLTGELGAGKTTLARGLGEGLGVRGAVTSPTFVIARVHPSLGDGPPLVHVDAYRLGGGLEEMEDLDLDVSLPESVVVVEWGEGRVEELSEDRLHVVIERSVGERLPSESSEDSSSDGTRDAGKARDAAVSGDTAVSGGAAVSGDAVDGADDVRTVTVTGVGARWAGLAPVG